jgi:hypothetical protein
MSQFSCDNIQGAYLYSVETSTLMPHCMITEASSSRCTESGLWRSDCARQRRPLRSHPRKEFARLQLGSSVSQGNHLVASLLTGSRLFDATHFHHPRRRFPPKGLRKCRSERVSRSRPPHARALRSERIISAWEAPKHGLHCLRIA